MLVMDCAQAHTCRRVLTQCRALKMSVVFIPGRCTWLLQSLDTHVFEKLKRVLRLERTKAAMTDAVGVVSDAVNIQAVGTAIHSTLVQKTWSTAMAQVGLGSTRTSLRQTLRHYVDDEEVSPRHPSVAELMFLMGRSTRTAIPWERLLFAPFEPHSFTDSPSAPAAAPSLAMEDSVQQPPARPWGRRASGSFHEDVLCTVLPTVDRRGWRDCHRQSMWTSRTRQGKDRDPPPGRERPVGYCCRRRLWQWQRRREEPCKKKKVRVNVHASDEYSGSQ